MSNRRKLPRPKPLRCPKCRRTDEIRGKGDDHVCMTCGHTWPKTP